MRRDDLRHPKRLGFKLGLVIRIGRPSRIIKRTADALKSDVVYIALPSATIKPLRRGEALKVGQTKGKLLSRWNGAIGIFGQRRLRNNETSDRDKWLREANGRQISVWVKPACKIAIPYARRLTTERFSSRCAEEEFLDHYYAPKLGISLSRRDSETGQSK